MMIEFDEKRPIYLQIYEDVLTRLFRGNLKMGEKLPSVREMAIDYTVNPTTIQRVIKELDDHDLITKERGKGTYITRDERMIMKIRKKVIKQEVSDFMDKMIKMGLSQSDILDAVKLYQEEGLYDD